MTVEASAAKEPGLLESSLASQALRHAAGTCIAVVAIGFAASRLEPTAASTPLIASPGYSYYLLALAISIAATFVLAGFTFDRRVLVESAPWEAVLLALGAASLLFVSYRSPAVILLVGVLAGLTAYIAQSSNAGPPVSAAAIGRYASILVILLLFIGGLLEFRMRTLYAAPVAALAALLAIRQLWIDVDGRETRLSGSLVAAVVSTEMIWALGFLNISTWMAASVWAASIVAVLYGFSVLNGNHRS